MDTEEENSRRENIWSGKLSFLLFCLLHFALFTFSLIYLFSLFFCSVLPYIISYCFVSYIFIMVYFFVLIYFVLFCYVLFYCVGLCCIAFKWQEEIASMLTIEQKKPADAETLLRLRAIRMHQSALSKEIVSELKERNAVENLSKECLIESLREVNKTSFFLFSIHYLSSSHVFSLFLSLSLSFSLSLISLLSLSVSLSPSLSVSLSISLPLTLYL